MKPPIHDTAQMEMFPLHPNEPRLNADELQIGGQHYKDMGVQPWALMEAVLTHEEFVGFLKGNCIKYAMRAGKKDSDDAGKYRHYALKLKEITSKGK